MGYYVNLNENTLNVPKEQVKPFAEALMAKDKARYGKFDTDYKIIKEYFSWLGWDVIQSPEGTIGTIVDKSSKLSYDEWDELESGEYDKFLAGRVMLIGQEGEGLTYDTETDSGGYYQPSEDEMTIEQLIKVIISKVNSLEELETYIGSTVDGNTKGKIIQAYKK